MVDGLLSSHPLWYCSVYFLASGVTLYLVARRRSAPPTPAVLYVNMGREFEVFVGLASLLKLNL